MGLPQKRSFHELGKPSTGAPQYRRKEKEKEMKPVPLRGWEYKFARGEFFGPKEKMTGGGFFETVYEPQETPTTEYKAIRLMADIVPYGRFLFPSGKDEYSRKTTWGQTKELLWEAATLIPIALVGKGLHVTAKLAGKVGTFPFKISKKFALKRTGKLLEQDPFLDIARSGVEKYERSTPIEKAIKKWQLTSEEGEKLLKAQPWIWEKGGRSGSLFQSKGSSSFQKLFKKDGFLQEKVRKQLEAWKRPHDLQELRHYTVEWNKLLKKTFAVDYNPDNVFKMQAVKLFGEEGKALKYGNIGTNRMALILRDLIYENPAKLVKRMDIGYGHIQPYQTLPVRVAMGFGNVVWGTFDKVYTPVKSIFTNVNKYGTLMTSRFHSILASRGLGKLTQAREAGVVGLKRSFSRKEWEEAGELVARMDDAVGEEMKQEAVQAILETGSLKAQKIAKSWWDFADDLYTDYVKKKIPMIFEEIGLTEKGRDGLKLLMRGPEGIEKYLNAGFSSSLNLAFDSKSKIVSGMLKKARESVKNLDWFSDVPVKLLTKPQREVLRERVVEGIKELTPMKKGGKKGFVAYLDKYATRIRDKQFAQSSARYDKLALKRKAGFTKGRIRDVSEKGRITDLTRIVEARINMQAKELYAYKPLEAVIKHASTLPDKYRNYSEHFIARQLGESSNADIMVAQWLTGTIGTFTRKVYDERSVANLAHTINDLVYMGGLGFKPFSAMRNYFQPLLMVPADMGGVKDFFWLGKGYPSAFRKSTRDYIKSIGAIQEFAPDLYLRPRVIGFGGSFTVRGKKFNLPSTQKMRDLALWMFKNSDRHNRYVTGGAAIEKWDYFAEKFLSKGLDSKAVKQFSKKLNVNSRREVPRAQLNELLRKETTEGLEEAKKVWVYDVIADTQYLYGTLDAPIYGQMYGGVGQMAGIFQSWWMNYGASLEKWALRTPEKAPIVNSRTMTWLLSCAIVEETTAQLWGRRTASKMTLLGPFPMKVNEFLIPPTFAPIYHAARTLANAIDGIRHQDSTEFKRSFNALLKSGVMFVPGGLQGAQFVRGGMKEGPLGVAKAIIKYKPEREEEY